MVQNLFAGVLLILSALPFTAPFATVDMPTLLGASSSAAAGQTAIVPTIEDGSHALVGSSVRTRVRLRAFLRLDPIAGAHHIVVPALHASGAASASAASLVVRPSPTALRI